MGKISDETLMQTRTKFAEFDTNGSGSIDRDELAGLLKSLGLAKYVASKEDIDRENGGEAAPVSTKKGGKKKPAPKKKEAEKKVLKQDKTAPGNKLVSIVEGNLYKTRTPRPLVLSFFLSLFLFRHADCPVRARWLSIFWAAGTNSCRIR